MPGGLGGGMDGVMCHRVWMKEIVTNGGACCTFFSLMCRMNIYLDACVVCQHQWHLLRVAL
jgi:hypothetical protein